MVVWSTTMMINKRYTQKIVYFFQAFYKCLNQRMPTAYKHVTKRVATITTLPFTDFLGLSVLVKRQGKTRGLGEQSPVLYKTMNHLTLNPFSIKHDFNRHHSLVIDRFMIKQRNDVYNLQQYQP